MNTMLSDLAKALRVHRVFRLPLIGLVLSVVFQATHARAFVVYNNTGVTIDATITDNGKSQTIQAGDKWNCAWDTSGCNPTGLRDGLLTLKITTPNSSDLDWYCQMSMQGGGYATVEDDFGYYVKTYDHTSNALRDYNAYGIKQSNRDVRFLVSADCQYIGSGGNTQFAGDNLMANTVNATMLSLKANDKRIRGILYAGDLTQNAWTYGSADEFEWYQESISGFARFVFDGLGNHDAKQSDDTIKSNPQTIIADIRDRKHNTAKAKKAGNNRAHYSWDWHDIHFVQLNVFPGDSTTPGRPNIDPEQSLQFLQNDLADLVGSSGRPVILLHHYGFDGFSTADGSACDEGEQEWWSEDARLAYWNAIAPYNVIAIFTGHKHLSPTTTRYSSCTWIVPWGRPLNATSGPGFIPTYISGAARNGVFLDVEINGANQVHITRRDENGNALENEYFSFSLPVYVDNAQSAPGYGWSYDPWSTVGEAAAAINKSARYSGSDENEMPVYISTGSYPEGVTFNSKALIQAVGGPVTIGN